MEYRSPSSSCGGWSCRVAEVELLPQVSVTLPGDASQREGPDDVLLLPTHSAAGAETGDLPVGQHATHHFAELRRLLLGPVKGGEQVCLLPSPAPLGRLVAATFPCQLRDRLSFVSPRRRLPLLGLRQVPLPEATACGCSLCHGPAGRIANKHNMIKFE